MMRSMFSGVSGLKVHQTRMDVIGNNIANVNTAGYKSQRVTFSDVFSQTLSSATSANDDTGRGGMNAMQVGLGVNVSSIDMLMTQGAAQRTDNPFDLMINGDGFMVVADSTGRYFTRSGALRLDDLGNLVNPNGMRVQGWLATDDGNGKYEINSQEVQDINLFDPKYQSMNPQITTKAQITGNVCSTSKKETFTVAAYDSLGNYYTIPLVMEPVTGKAGEWDLKIPTTDRKKDDGTADTPAAYITDAKGNKLRLSANEVKLGTITFDKTGKCTNSAKEFPLDMTKPEEPLLGGAQLEKVTVDFSSITQYATKSTVEGKETNGNSAGTLSGYAISKDGIINVNYTNGEQRKIAQVVVANFDNPAGLEKVGDNLYLATTNSGEFDGIGDAGNFSTGVLEMSNVDLSAEFTDMIITQRGFQANSRIITVSDEMLQELTNLKR